MVVPAREPNYQALETLGTKVLVVNVLAVEPNSDGLHPSPCGVAAKCSFPIITIIPRTRAAVPAATQQTLQSS